MHSFERRRASVSDLQGQFASRTTSILGLRGITLHLLFSGLLSFSVLCCGSSRDHLRKFLSYCWCRSRSRFLGLFARLRAFGRFPHF